MSRKSSGGGGGVKRKRQQQLVEEVAPTSLQVTVHSEPLMLMALVKSYHGTLVCAQMCTPQDGFMFSHVRLPSRVLRPFTDTPVYDMSLTHAERLCAMGCGFRGKLVQLLSMGASYLRYFEPQENWGACHRMMRSNVRRVASKLLAAERDKAAKQADELCASGQCAAALTPLKRAIYFGDFASLALQAWLILWGREGILQDEVRGFELAEWGAQLGCHHCQGVVACCYFQGFGRKKDYALSLKLARESSECGSKYGQAVLADLYDDYPDELEVCDEDQAIAQAVALYQLAAAQGLDWAQMGMGCMCREGAGVPQNYVEALRWYRLAADQGHPQGFVWIAHCYENGDGVTEDLDTAEHWFKRARDAGDKFAAQYLCRIARARNLQI
jgi:TPR repeat protein